MKKILLFFCWSYGILVSTAQTSEGPTSYLSPRPSNPVISNKYPRLYQESDGPYVFTPFEAASSELQKQNFDKILFATKRIDKDGPASQCTAVFHTGDAIYGRVFMRSSLLNYKVYMTEISEEPAKCMSGNFDVNVYIDGIPQAYYLMSSSLSGGLEDKSTFTVIAIGTGDDAEINNEEFIKTLNGLSAGNHKVKLVVWATQGQFISYDPVAMGEFTFVKDANAKTIGLGRSFANVPVGMEDAALEAKILKKLSEHGKANGWKENFTKVKITDEDWTIIRNQLTSVITGRQISFTALATWPDGHCTIQDFSVMQEYDGAGYQNALHMQGIGEQQEVDCN